MEETTISSDICEPPYLKAIQSLNGQTPGEKYKNLNVFIQELVKICQTTGTNSDDLVRAKQQEIPASLLPLVRILLGIELKSAESVVEALRSPNVAVVNKALRAKWFFDGSNSHVDAPYFKENIFPFVSVRTRMDIVKALTRGLYDAKGKAENFFTSFYDMFGLEQAMTFLPYCSEEFLFKTILNFKIVLPIKMLDIIFQRYPNLAIRYLYLGFQDCERNELDKKIHTINLSPYAKFFPRLIKDHVDDYIKLLPCVHTNSVKIGSTRSRALLKNVKDFSLRQKMFKKTWSLKQIYYSLSKEEFEKEYASLHPENSWSYNFTTMFNSLKFYPKNSRIDLMKNQYEKVYKQEFFEHLDAGINMSKIAELFNDDLINEQQFEKLYASIFPKYYYQFNIDNLVLSLKNYSNEKMLNLLYKNMKKKNFTDILEAHSGYIQSYASEKYFLLLPNEEKCIKARHLLSFYRRKTDSYYDWCCFLPVDESFNIFKLNAESSSSKKRKNFLKRMIHSCKIHDDQNHLTKVLKYYIQRHKNEHSSTLDSILLQLMNQFNILSLNDINWQLFCEIVETAYIRNELFNARIEVVNKVFEKSMHRLYIQSTQQMQEGEMFSLDAMVHKYLEFQIAYNNNAHWTIFETLPDLEREFIKLLLLNIPIKYPENHPIWEDDDKRIIIVSNIIFKLRKHNEKIIKALKPSERKTNVQNTKIIRGTDYIWLKEVSQHLVQQPNSKNSLHYQAFIMAMKTFDEEFYLSVIPVNISNIIRKNILSGKAAWSSKNNSNAILNSWEEYFNVVRNMLRFKSKKGSKAAKTFIISIKWHEELPLRFVKRCIAEIDKPGSLKMLALLVDGETLSKFLMKFVPSSPTLDIQKINAKEDYQIMTFIPSAINVSVPLVSSEILMSLLQHEYIKLGHRSVRNFGLRGDKQTVINFARQLSDRPVSIKKHGIRLMFLVFTIDEIMEFLTELSNFKHHPTINMIIAHRIFYLFTKFPNDKTWNLINNFVDKLRCYDLLAFKVLTNAKLVCNQYAPLYFKKILGKIDDLEEQLKQMNTDKMEVDDPDKLWSNDREPTLKEKLIKSMFENVSEESAMFLTKEIIIDILRTYYFKANTKNISQTSRKFANKIFSRPFIGRK